jgi:hypothetical protein
MAGYYIQQVAYAAPLLLIYLIGIALSLAFLRRHPLPSLLALAGTLILFLTGIGIVIAQGSLLRFRVQSDWTVSYYTQMLMIVNLFGTIFRTVGSALLVAAIFAGRKNRATPDVV